MSGCPSQKKALVHEAADRFEKAWTVCCMFLEEHPQDKALLLCTDDVLLRAAQLPGGASYSTLKRHHKDTVLDRLDIRSVPLVHSYGLPKPGKRSARNRKALLPQSFEWILLFATLERTFCAQPHSEYALVVLVDFLNHLQSSNRSNWSSTEHTESVSGPKSPKYEAVVPHCKAVKQRRCPRNRLRERRILLNVLRAIVQGNHCPGESCIKRTLSPSVPTILIF